MKKLLNILSRPQVLILLSLGVLFFSFGVVGNIVGGGGCGGRGGENAEDIGGDDTERGVGGKFYTGATGKLDEKALGGLHPVVQEIIKGNQFIERDLATTDMMLANPFFDLVHHLYHINNKQLLATPLNYEGESLARLYGPRLVIPKGEGINMALPKIVTLVPPLTMEDQKRSNGEMKPIVYVGGKENYPNCEAIKFSELKSKYITIPTYDTALAEIKEKIKNPKTPSCSLELAIRIHCDGKGGAIIKVLPGILEEGPWDNSKELLGTDSVGYYSDKTLYSTMYLQKECSGMVITNDNNQNAEIRFKGIDIAKNTPDGTLTDKGAKDGNWYLADKELNVYTAKWSSNTSILGDVAIPQIIMDGKPMVSAGTVLDDAHDPVKRDYAPLIAGNYDSSTMPSKFSATGGHHTPNFKESTGPLYWYLRSTSNMVQYFHGHEFMACKTPLGCQKAGGVQWFDKEGDPRLTDGKMCKYPDFYAYEVEKNPDGTTVYGEDGNNCAPVHKKTSSGGLILRKDFDFYSKIDEIAGALLADPNTLINYRHVSRILPDTMLRKKFCEPLYGEAACKFGGFIFLKLPAGDSPSKHKIELPYPGFWQLRSNSLKSVGKLLVRGVRLNLSIYATGETDHTYTPGKYTLKLDGVELVTAHLSFTGGGALIVDNSYFNGSLVEPLETKDPGSRIFNTLSAKAYGKPVFGTPTLGSISKKWGQKPYWEETFADAGEWGYMKFSFNTIYKGGGLNGKHDGWLVDDNAWVNGGPQECIVEGLYDEGTKNFRAHNNLCINSGAGTALSFVNSSNIEIVNNQFIRFHYEGDELSMAKLSYYYDKFMSSDGGILGISGDSKDIVIENNLFAKTASPVSSALGINSGVNIKVRHNTIASGNEAIIEKEMEASSVWQWDPVKNKYLYFTTPATIDTWTVKSPAKYTIKNGMKLPGSAMGIVIGKRSNSIPEDHVLLESNLAVGSVTDDFTKLIHMSYRGDYAETSDIPLDSKLIDYKTNYFEICGQVNHSPGNIAGNETTYLDFAKLEKGTGIPFKYAGQDPLTDKCIIKVKDLQYFYSLGNSPKFKDPANNDFHITNPATLACTPENKYSRIGFNYFDERCGGYALSYQDSKYKNIELKKLIEEMASGYPKGNLDKGYPSYGNAAGDGIEIPLTKYAYGGGCTAEDEKLLGTTSFSSVKISLTPVSDGKYNATLSGENGALLWNIEATGFNDSSTTWENQVNIALSTSEFMENGAWVSSYKDGVYKWSNCYSNGSDCVYRSLNIYKGSYGCWDSKTQTTVYDKPYSVNFGYNSQRNAEQMNGYYNFKNNCSVNGSICINLDSK